MNKIYLVGVADNEGFHHLIAFEDCNVAYAVAYGLCQYSKYFNYEVEPLEIVEAR